MSLSPPSNLAIAKIVFFSLAFLISIPILLHHGFKKQAGFLTILTLSVLRLIGAACTLYSTTNYDYSQSLLETAFITSYIGSGALLFTVSAFVGRVNADPSRKRGAGIPSSGFRLNEVITLAAVILSIVGAVKESSSNANSVAVGHSLLEAAGFLFLGFWIVLGLMLGYLFLFLVLRKQVDNDNESSQRFSDDRLLIIIGVISLPFLLVRLIYGICTAFSRPGATFSPVNGSVYVQAFMEFAMEAVVVCLFVFAGLKVSKVVKSTETGAVKEVNSIGEHDSKHLTWIAREAQSARRV